MHGGSDTPACGPGRSVVFAFLCDRTVPAGNPPEPAVIEQPWCTYTVTWKTPAACAPVRSGSGSGDSTAGQAKCGAMPPPPPPIPWTNTRVPRWNPTWQMNRSTVLYACNTTGMHDVAEAVKFGLVVYDWSNGIGIWAKARPMDAEALLLKQAEAVLAADPGVPGGAPRVWVYRNTIKALNWFGSVREKLEDPAYSGWFVRFKDYRGPSSNGSYHVPACTYVTGAPPKCSGFYHDHQLTPQANHGGYGGGCDGGCDCGAETPCGEYIFDHRNDSFADWFVNGYMVNNQTLNHSPLPIGLGWLDDTMLLAGPTEENHNFVADTGSTPKDMQEHARAYERNMYRLSQAVVPVGGFFWQLGKGWGPELTKAAVHRYPRIVEPADCAKKLRETYCTARPSAWDDFNWYSVDPEYAVSNATDITAEFLLTRGPFAYLGYSWDGCESGTQTRPYPKEWGVDYGTPHAPCAETEAGSMVFTRSWSHARVTWDCNTQSGAIEIEQV